MYVLSALYAVVVVALAVFGFNLLLMALLAAVAWLRSARARPAPAAPAAWPAVVVQLPIFNERYVVERLIDAAAALDYPAPLLALQVLDDSDDDTSAIARARVAHHRARGCNIAYFHRTGRAGFKAGALAEGLRAAPPASEFVAVFDADFVPPPDFLRRALPILLADPGLGMLQARWDHLNAGDNALTRAQALALDSYFAVDQVARSRWGLLLNFNGSAGVWRRACIEAAGGWQGDTLAEDLDLSYRAQLKGWRLGYASAVAAPAELPSSLMAFKRQQFRWAKGSFQVLRKLGRDLAAARLSPVKKALGFLHLCGYLPHPLMVISLLLSLPVVLLHAHAPLNWNLLGLASLGPLLAGVLGQLLLRRDWPLRLRWYPVLILLGIGLALTNTRAMWQAYLGGRQEFLRTPKGRAAAPHASVYALALDWTTWGELLLAVYALATALLAARLAPGLVPLMCLYALGFGFTAALGFWQHSWLPMTRRPVADSQ